MYSRLLCLRLKKKIFINFYIILITILLKRNKEKIKLFI